VGLSRKGQAGAESQQVLFLITEIVLGAALLLLTAHFVINEMSDSKEEMLAKDLAFTISTVMGSPANMFYKYAPNTEELTVDIGESDYVQVNSQSGQGKFELIPLEGIGVERKTLAKVLSIPIIFENNKVSFTEQTASSAIQDRCALIPSSFSQIVKIKISVKGNNPESNAKLDAVKSKIEEIIALNQNGNIQLASITESPDINIILSMESIDNNELRLYYYETSGSYNYQKISCSVSREFSVDANGNKKTIFDAINEIPDQTNKQITISLGSSKKLSEKLTNNPNLLDEYASNIYSGMQKGVKK
jgi:hypothetical protein